MIHATSARQSVVLQLDQSALGEHKGLRRFVPEQPALTVPEVQPAVLEGAMRAWEDRARSEYIGVMVMRRFHGLLVDLNAPLDLQDLALQMMLHEQRHTAMCMHAAAALGSTCEISFDLAELQQSRAESNPEVLALRMLCGTFATGEVVAQSLIKHSIKSLPSSGFRDILKRIAKDEVLHSTFGGILLAALKSDAAPTWLEYPGDAWVSACVFEHIEAMKLRDVIEPGEALLFEDATQASQMMSLGIPPSPAFKSHYLWALETEVIGGFERLGITLNRSDL